MHDLAVYQTNGEGGPQSYANAAAWYRKAAEFGVVDSQFNLAVFYQDGLGISPDLAEALFWFEIAGRSGDADARSTAQLLAGRVGPDVARDIRDRAEGWAARTSDPEANGSFGPQPWNGGISQDQALAIQIRLNGLGYDAGIADGMFGQKTGTALAAFAEDQGLEVTPGVSADIISALNAATPS
ncbi:MAG: SEL1-like repeat protein [Pseudomonadota bacterium]